MIGKRFVAMGLLFLALLQFFPARAITLTNFIRLTTDDKATYVSNMVQGTADMFKKNGQPDLADKTIALFHDTSKQGGVSQFAQNLKTINAINNNNATNARSQAKPLQIEDAMAMTLKDAGIVVTVKFLLSINKGFMPGQPDYNKLMQEQK